MSSIIKSDQPTRIARGVAFNLDDIARQADQALQEVRGEAAQLLAKANGEAEAVRQQAQEDGRGAALRAAEKILEVKVSRQLETLLPALREAVEEVHHCKGQWLSHCEKSTVHLAAAIAARVIRRELSQTPKEIPLTLIREALELAVGSPSITMRLNPDDHAALGGQVARLADSMSGLAPAQVVADAEISAGGCRVDTNFGVIDQQFEAQLERIEQDLA